MRHPRPISRRMMLAALAAPALQGCTAPLPPLRTASSSPDAEALMAASATSHGLAGLQSVTDISVGYTGAWHSFVDVLQPDLVDAGFRGTSQERLLLPGRLVAQSHTGLKGHKEVVRRNLPGSEGEVRVWFNDVETHDRDKLAAAALVADGYSLFLLGPMLLVQPGRSVTMELAAPERITVFGREYDCDVLRIRLQPGLGLSPSDNLALFVSRDDTLMHRVRFSLEGLDATQGAVAEVDTGAHVTMHGVRWPTLFHERLLRPVPIPVHDWHLVGLDVNRGLTAAEVDGAALVGQAARPATDPA